MLLTLVCHAFLFSASAESFVQVSGAELVVDSQPYHFLGTTFWQGMNLASEGPGGNRARLLRELDRLKALGILNLRVMGLTQGPNREPWRIVPALETTPRHYDKVLLSGLDFLLAEMAKRGQRAVIVLNNFWPWSGGMAQYHSWSIGSPIPYPPPEPGGGWDEYENFTAGFYGDRKAVEWADDAIKMLVTRRNEITKKFYRDDPAIMAWELAESPRGMSHPKEFNAWIDSTASFIKSLDARHLVTAGVDGQTSNPQQAGLDFARNHSSKAVDYATIHVWPQEWGWYDPASTTTFDSALQKARDYIDWHAAQARELHKPLVVEEFGMSRDGGSVDPSASTRLRDAFFEAVLSSSSSAAGFDFWAWAGEGKFPGPGVYWQPGEVFTGDPPHQPQGLYSVYDTDAGASQVFMRYNFSSATAPGQEGLPRP